MKKLILLLSLISSIAYPQYSNSYNEINAGVLFDGISFEGSTVIDADLIFPGASFLWGRTKYYQNNTFLDYQLGLAFPTIITGKIGFGIGNSESAISISSGLRPWPPTAYMQLNVKEIIIFSIEPFTFMGPSSGIINLGLRF